MPGIGGQELGARNWGPGILNGGPWEGWEATENR